MSAMDDFFDTKAALVEYCQAFERWQASTGGDEGSGWTPETESLQKRHATRVMKALLYLAEVATEGLDSMHRRGWTLGKVGWHCTRCRGAARGPRPDEEHPMCPGCKHENCRPMKGNEKAERAQAEWFKAHPAHDAPPKSATRKKKNLRRRKLQKGWDGHGR